MLINFNLEGLEKKDKREIKYLLQCINDTLEGGIWHTNIKKGAITGVLSDSLYNTKIGTEAINSNTTGFRNVAMGYQALYNNTIGYHNTALGCLSLYNNSEGYHNIAVGYQTLYSITFGRENTAIGYQALFSNTANQNSAMGYKSLYKNTTGYENVAIGCRALYFNTTGNQNVAIGWETLHFNTTGYRNTGVGRTLYVNTTGYENVAVGYGALYDPNVGYRNVAIGALALFELTSGHSNIAIGYAAGFSEHSGSNKLYIENSASTTPLIYGEFDNDLITIYGNLGIGTKTFGTSATRTLGLINGTIPSTSPANAVQLYAEDVSASSELKVRDEATNVTTLSPHNFELFKPSKNDPFPWSYHSINHLIGKKVNADISGALRELEKLTGKQFIYYENIDKISLSEYLENKKEELITIYIEEHTTEVEVEKDEAWGEVEVEEQDTKKIIGNDIEYEFDEKTGKVKEIKKPKYGIKKVLKNKLKNGYRFNEKTGKFLKKIKPTKKEAEKEIKKELIIPDWIKERL